jgi:two-component system, NtrC family, response regulator AtoC
MNKSPTVLATQKAPASILIVDDEESFRDMLITILKPEGYWVETANDGVHAINALQNSFFDLVLLDVHMPRVDGIEVLNFIKDHYIDTQVVMLTGVEDVRIAVDCMKLGAYHYLTKPYSSNELITVIERALERRRLVIENKVMKSELARRALSSNLIGQSQAFLSILELASKVAPTDSTVLIEGASGTGKELFAGFLHRNSLRSEKPFVALSCASIPDALIESELFGHEKGAFTDAYAMRQGLVEIANGGTLFMDEIGEISPVFQPKLLRFIQTGEFRRVGGNETMKSDVRLISATNRHLVDEVKKGNFREDLLYRVNVITLTIPSLQERKEDIPLLAAEIFTRKLKIHGPKMLPPETIQALLNYNWPGNVRELENVLERAAIMSTDNNIRPKDLAFPPDVSMNQRSEGGGGKIGSAVSIDDIEHEHIEGVLGHTKWDKKLAAKILGISLKTLYTKIQHYHLSKK